MAVREIFEYLGEWVNPLRIGLNGYIKVNVMVSFTSEYEELALTPHGFVK